MTTFNFFVPNFGFLPCISPENAAYNINAPAKNGFNTCFLEKQKFF